MEERKDGDSSGVWGLLRKCNLEQHSLRQAASPPEGDFLRHPGSLQPGRDCPAQRNFAEDRKSTRLNSSHGYISYAVFCLQKKQPPIPRCSDPRCERAVHLPRHVDLLCPLL